MANDLLAARYIRDLGNADYFPGNREAIDQIFGDYGDVVSISQKAKRLLKFGRTSNADDGVKTTVASFQDDVVNETFATTNSIDRIISTSGSDTTQTMVIEGHYFDGDNNLIFSSQEAELNGQTAVTLTRALCRATRLYVKTTGTVASPTADLVGDVAVYDATAATGTTGGKPDVDASVKLMALAGINQSEKCATSVSASDYWIIDNVAAAAQRGNSSTTNVDIEVEVRELGGVFRPLGFELSIRTGATSSISETLSPPLIIPKNSDVRMVAISNAANTTVSGRLNGYLALIVG